MCKPRSSPDGSALAKNKRQLLDTLYPVPDPFVSREQSERYKHEDLLSLSRSELKVELERVRFRLLFEDYPEQWMLDRLDAIEEVIRNVS